MFKRPKQSSGATLEGLRLNRGGGTSPDEIFRVGIGSISAMIDKNKRNPVYQEREKEDENYDEVWESSEDFRFLYVFLRIGYEPIIEIK